MIVQLLQQNLVVLELVRAKVPSLPARQRDQNSFKLAHKINARLTVFHVEFPYEAAKEISSRVVQSKMQDVRPAYREHKGLPRM